MLPSCARLSRTSRFGWRCAPFLALPLRTMAPLFCGRGGSKPPAGSNQSKDRQLRRGLVRCQRADD